VDDVLRYAGKRVIVSGAASGVGASVTKLLVDLGAEVHAIDTTRPGQAGIASFTETDLRAADQIESAVGKIGSVVDALFNCALVPEGEPALRHLVEHVVPNMIPGSAIASIAPLAPPTDELSIAAYTTARAASLANEYGVRINCVATNDTSSDNAAWPLLFLNSSRAASISGEVVHAGVQVPASPSPS
jgi:NADPH:quinone reductase-like Zn-dependent oxidoreductase